jgi:Secretion system C-terminal sorting domain
MSAMLSGYSKGTAATPVLVGRLGYGTPVKDAVMRNSSSANTTGFATIAAATNSLLVYPNPVVSSARIALPAPSVGKVSAMVIDMNGSVLRKFSFAPGTSVLDVDMSKLPAGMYSVRVSGDAAAPYNLKVVKQ